MCHVLHSLPPQTITRTLFLKEDTVVEEVTLVETRIDSAFFSETVAEQLQGAGVEFTISVPFERFTELKRMI